MAKKTTKTIRAAIYARFSSANQRDESIDAQVRAITDYAQKNNILIVKEYIDRAKTATSDKRPSFQEMIKDSTYELFDAVIIHKLDRFSRNKLDFANYKNILQKNNVRLISVTEHLDDTPESGMMESMYEGMAVYHSRNLAREVMKGMKENALKCQHTGGKPPLGYDIDHITKKYIINAEEARTVKLIFDLYLGGYGYDYIVRELNKRGYKTKIKNHFGKNSIHDILANEKYSGVYVYNRAKSKNWDGTRNSHRSKPEEEIIKIPGGVPSIIDEETFAKAQEKMKNNRRQPGAYKAKETYLLSGLIICGECLEREGKEYSMMGNVKHSGRNKTKHVTYRCGNRESKHICDNKEIRREYIENFVLKQLETNILSEKAIASLVKKLNEFQNKQSLEKDAELAGLKENLKTINKEIKNIVDAVTQGFASQAMAKKLQELEETQAEMETRMKIISNSQGKPEITEEQMRVMFSMFRKYVAERNIPEIKKFISSYIEKVIIYKDHVEVVFSLCPKKEGYDTFNLTATVSRQGIIKLFVA